MEGSTVYSGVRFLITQPLINRICGSTMVTMELAEFLQDNGALVTVYTYALGQPSKGLFEDRGISILAAESTPDLRLEDFDYIWVHSQALPISIVKQLTGTLPESLPTFIFYHMSALETISDERPYIWGLEERLSSLSLFVSPEAHNAMADYFLSDDNHLILPNPAPIAYSNVDYEASGTLRKLLIVSNHPPKELLEVKDILRERGVEVVWSGEHSSTYTHISPEYLATFDAVVTIGKTVQYCLVSGIPVFVYDRYGGIGYLTDEVIKSAAEVNFSGREAKQLSAEELTDQIIDGYSAAVEYQGKNRQAFIEQWTIDRVLPDIIETAQPRVIESFPKEYGLMVESAQLFAERLFGIDGTLINVFNDLRNTQIERDSLLHEREHLLRDRNTLERLQTSKRMRIADGLAIPIEAGRKVTKKAVELLSGGRKSKTSTVASGKSDSYLKSRSKRK